MPEEVRHEWSRVRDLLLVQEGQSLETHVEAIREVRASIEEKVLELRMHCQHLQREVRRTASTSQQHYRLYSTAHLRLSGAMQEVLKRTKSAERILSVGKAEQEEQERIEAQEREDVRDRAVVRSVNDLQLPREDDFESLFGPEVTDA